MCGRGGLTSATTARHAGSGAVQPYLGWRDDCVPIEADSCRAELVCMVMSMTTRKSRT